MGVLESLASLIGAVGPDEVNFALGGDVIDIEDVEREAELTIKSGTSDEKVALSEERVVIYPDQLRGEEYASFQQFVNQAKAAEGRITRSSETGTTRALESVNRDLIDETCSFFDEVLSSRQLSLLRSALFIREVSGSTEYALEKDIDQSKADLKDRYGYEAYYVCHLASSGYYDEGRYFRDLYFELESGSEPVQKVYRDHYDQIIGEKLIAAFVNSEDDVEDVLSDARAGLSKFFRYNPPADFFDICGMGSRCSELIDLALEEFSSEYDSLEYEDRDRGEERVARLYPYSLKEGLDIWGS